MNWPSFFSGLVGAMIGSATTIFVYWHSNFASAQRRLQDKLTLLRHDTWWKLKDDAAFGQWENSLRDLWELYHAYYAWAFWKRRKLDRAWRAYKGTNEEKVAITPDSKRPPPSRQDLLDRINTLLGAL